MTFWQTRMQLVSNILLALSILSLVVLVLPAVRVIHQEQGIIEQRRLLEDAQRHSRQTLLEEASKRIVSLQAEQLSQQERMKKLTEDNCRLVDELNRMLRTRPPEPELSLEVPDGP